MWHNFQKLQFAFLGLITAGSAYSIENTKVLPKGVRSFNIKSVQTSVDQKTDAQGFFHSIAEPLAKDFTFRKVIEGEKNPTNRLLLQSFLQGKFSESDSLGTFSADMKGNIQVTGGIFSYGATDNLTLALGIPYYQAKMHVRMGFRASENAQRFVAALNEHGNNQTAKAREVADKLTFAVRELNKKLTDNGYSEIQDFERSGIGDITVGAKYLFVEQSWIKTANASGVIAPTGYAGDPNVLVNVPFGTGSWGLFTTFYTDEFIREDLWFNQYVKYTYQVPTHKNVRMKTEDESITVPEERLGFKPGDRWEAGVSTQYEPWFGLMAAVGLSYAGKNGDRYDTDNLVSKNALEKDGFERASFLEARIGYQSIPAFRRKEIPVPFVVSLEMKRHLSSINTVVKDLYTADFSLYF